MNEAKDKNGFAAVEEREKLGITGGICRLMLKKICFAIIITLFLICPFLAATGSSSKSTGYAKISFGGETYMPEFVIEDVNDEGDVLRLGFDSGYSYEAIYGSAIKKLGAENFLANTVAQQYIEKYPGLSQEKLIKMVETYLSKGDKNITVFMKLNDIDIYDGFHLDSYDFQYDAAPISRDMEDGIVGLKFFSGCDRLTIDYVNKIIEVNGEPLSGEKGTLTRIPKMNLYKTKISVDGIKQDAIIDTGAQVFVLCDESALKMGEKKKLDFIANGTLKKTSHTQKTATVSFGGMSKELEAFKATDKDAKVMEQGRRAGYVYSLLGYSFFEGHRIQFDFKNGTFIIE